MPETSEKHRPSISSVRRNTEGKLKISRSKSKFINPDIKEKSESRSLNGLKKTQLNKSDTEKESNQNITENVLEIKDETTNSGVIKDLKQAPKSEHSDKKSNGIVASVSDKPLSKTTSVQEETIEIKRATKKDSEKLVVLPRDLTNISLDTPSEVIADGQIQPTSVLTPTDRPRSVIAHNDSFIRSVIPYLPLGLAIVFLILNIIIPGSGTILSGFSILCCGKCRVQTKDDQRLVTLCVNVCVGVSQLFTVTFLLVGWFWSIAWGVTMVTLAVDLRRQKKQQRERELQATVLNAFGNPAQVRSLFTGLK